MIDRTKRGRLAEAMRQLLSGCMDNLAFDDLDCRGGVTDSKDRALPEIFYSMWLCYDDFHSHPLELTEGQRLDLKRCILFLHSDVEFEWPPQRPRIGHRLRRIAAGIVGPSLGWWPPPSPGDMAVWPFFRSEDYQRALHSPRLLRGKVEPTAASNGGPATPLGNSGVAEGPPSVS
jgi:hypothetical protein